MKVFLASPGDLESERLAAKAVIDEENGLWADHTGYQVELVGWEDTVSGPGRPQAIINRDLEQCEYFIGMMWKRWGTPPTVSGRYTSGFEEEFETSMGRYRKTGRPEISLFFKEIDEELLADPGHDLRKVIDFKKKIIDRKEILFEQFSDIAVFRQKIKRCVMRYVQRLIAAETQENESQLRSSTSGQGSRDESQPASASKAERQFSVEGMKFLQKLLSETEENGHHEPPNSVEVARFRLLASVISNENNDKISLGPHDSNILYMERSELELSKQDKIGLINSGLEHFSSENTPLWHWLMTIGAFTRPWLAIRSIWGAETEQQIGALAAMRLLSEPLPSAAGLSREDFINIWFANDAPGALKVSALRYLADCGIVVDVSAIESEVKRGDYQTKDAAVDAILRIKLRDSREQAILALVELQPLAIDSGLLHRLFESGASIGTDLLIGGVEHRNKNVRRIIAKLLGERRSLNADTAEKLTSDDDAEIRFEALKALEQSGRHFSADEAKRILIKPTQGIGITLLGGWSATDTEGEAQWDRFRQQRIEALTIEDLKRVARDSTIFDPDARFVMDERLFSSRGDALRAAVDDQFKTEFADEVAKMTQQFGSERNLIERTKSLEENLRKELTRRGLNIISRRKDPQDLGRVRRIIRSGFVECSDIDIEYLIKRGEWEDISLIISWALQPKAGINTILSGNIDNKKCQAAARAIYTIGHKRLRDLIELDIPDRFLCYLILEFTDKAFRGLDDTSIARLLHSGDEYVRKAASLKCVRSLPKRRSSKLLEGYISDQSVYYYNVVFWLDFAVSVPRDRARAASEKEILREWPG